MSKRYSNINVFDAAIERINWTLDNFPAYYVSLSGGKDSGAMLQLVIACARAKNRLPVPVLFFDWETCYQDTIDFVERMILRDEIEPYWICLPEAEDNGSSIFERYWKPWDPNKQEKWIRPMPTHDCVIHIDNMPVEWQEWYDPDSYSLWIVKRFGDWFAHKKGVECAANFLGLRTVESYGRHMLVATGKYRNKLKSWCYRTKDNGDRVYISLPIYDWTVEDIWTAVGKNNWDYNRAYDKMFLAGKKLHEMRICNAFGESQKRDLDMWQIVEPETWNRVVERVQGANFGAMYNGTSLSSLKTKKPDGVTWEQFTWLLYESLPPEAKANFQYRFNVIFRWFENHSRDKLGLNQWWFDTKKEAKEFVKANNISIAYVGSWETMANFITKRDWMCKKYGFSESARTDRAIQTLFEKYKDL